MLEIRTMTAADIDFAVSLTDRENWGNVASDFTRLTALEPGGCFVAWDTGERIGMITTTTYGDYAFMGSLIVRPDRRRRGTGESLMRRAMEYLHQKNIACIELDATPAGVPLYRRLGFRDKYASLRLWRPADGSPSSRESSSSGHNSAETVDIVTAIDRRLTGLDRSRLLARLIEEFSGSAIMDASSPHGYALVYPRSGNRLHLGPLIAADESTAEAILDIVLQSHGSYEIDVGVPETRSAPAQIFLDRGFRFYPPSLRMYRGQERRYETHVYAIVSAEKG